MLELMQKEDLLRKIRLWATVVTSAFVVLIVALVIQFGLIAYHNSERARLQTENAAKQELVDSLHQDQAYYETDFRDEYLTENGKKSH